MVKEPKRPWLAAMLAFFLGGPGFFYLGLRRGLVATIEMRSHDGMEVLFLQVDCSARLII